MLEARAWALHQFDVETAIAIAGCAHVEFAIFKQHVEQRESKLCRFGIPISPVTPQKGYHWGIRM
jgi:hypothetical protein